MKTCGNGYICAELLRSHIKGKYLGWLGFVEGWGRGGTDPQAGRIYPGAFKNLPGGFPEEK
jgi:hypothetical protein